MGYYAYGSGSLKLKENAVIPEDVLNDVKDFFDVHYLPGDNSIELFHPDDSYHDDGTKEVLNKIAPFIHKGDVTFHGDDDADWQFHFWCGMMHEKCGYIVYEDVNKDQRHSDRMELLGCMIDAVEDWLESKGITADDIPCEDRDHDIADGEDPESCAIIYGEDYDILSNAFETTLINFGLIEKEC